MTHKIALLGNPNSGKSSLFNVLTGLNQRVSNFPGVTVEKKSGRLKSVPFDAEVTDLPGTYSLFPHSTEEKLVVDILMDRKNPIFPDLVLYVADVTQLERHLLLATQVLDLGFPMIFVVNMIDLVPSFPDINTLEIFLGCPVVLLSARQPQTSGLLLEKIRHHFNENAGLQSARQPIYGIPEDLLPLLNIVKEEMHESNLYRCKLICHHTDWLKIAGPHKAYLKSKTGASGFEDIKNQVIEVMERYRLISKTLQNIYPHRQVIQNDNDSPLKIDRILTHRLAGPILFFGLLLLIFQAVYSLATYPMDWIEASFSALHTFLADSLPPSFWTSLLMDGVVAGLSGVLVFIPQIAILFFMLALLEESGYMSRAVFMFDRIMQKFGMNGRSIVSLVSSGACAIPAIMSTRTISNPREKLITILVSPLISCSARLPVYAVLVGFVVPDITVLGVFNAPGLVFMGLYLLGIFAAFTSALVFKKLLKTSDVSYLIMELPQYKTPIWKNVWVAVKNKVWSFISEAGKVILLISVILWFLASFGPEEKILLANQKAQQEITSKNLSEVEALNTKSSYRLEASYAGIMGKWIEPAIKPLGFDWKIGIALITSFAAREVFVGTMATIYSIGNTDDTATVREKMKAEKKADGISKVYDPPTALALLIFYVFAMQCMSTLAVTRKETNSWKWPAVQFGYMGFLAWTGAFLAYHLVSFIMA